MENMVNSSEIGYCEGKRVIDLADSMTESMTESTLSSSSRAGSSSGSFAEDRSISSPSKSQLLGWPLGKGSWRKSSGKIKKKTITNLENFGFKKIGTETSEIELMKERMAKLLLGEDMSSGEGVCPALAISNAITNLYGAILGQQWRLEPFSSEKKIHVEKRN